MKTKSQQRHLHDVACMAAQAAAGRIQDETPDAAAQIVVEAYLRALGRLQSSIQTVQAEWDVAATMEAGRRAGFDFVKRFGSPVGQMSASSVVPAPRQDLGADPQPDRE